MAKVGVVKDELWPWFILETKEKNFRYCEGTGNLTEAEINEYNEVSERFFEWQDKLGDLLNEAN